MFSGFIADVGTVIQNHEAVLVVESSQTCARLSVGAHVAIDGVRTCVESFDADRFKVRLTHETLSRSTTNELRTGQRVNLELPLSMGDSIEGHLVQGHVDAVGKVTRVDDEGSGLRLWIRPPERVLKSLVSKGSVAVNGVSLAIAEVIRDRFSVALVASTIGRTTLGSLSEGDRVNLETDMLAKLADRSAGLRQSAARCIAPLPWTGVVTGAVGVQKVIEQIKAGGAVLVWDPDREVEGDVIFAGAHASPEHFAFILTEACCHPTVPCDGEVLERLEIPPMHGSGDHQGTWMYTSVDLAEARGTGVSAHERAATVRRLAAVDSTPDEFLMPGHVFPLRARDDGFAQRVGHTESVVALCRAADLPPVGVCCEVMNRSGTMAGPADLEQRSLEWGLPLVNMDDLVRFL